MILKSNNGFEHVKKYYSPWKENPFNSLLFTCIHIKFMLNYENRLFTILHLFMAT